MTTQKYYLVCWPFKEHTRLYESLESFLGSWSLRENSQLLAVLESRFRVPGTHRAYSISWSLRGHIHLPGHLKRILGLLATQRAQLAGQSESILGFPVTQRAFQLFGRVGLESSVSADRGEDGWNSAIQDISDPGRCYYDKEVALWWSLPLLRIQKASNLPLSVFLYFTLLFLTSMSHKLKNAARNQGLACFSGQSFTYQVTVFVN